MKPATCDRAVWFPRCHAPNLSTCAEQRGFGAWLGWRACTDGVTDDDRGELVRVRPWPHPARDDNADDGLVTFTEILRLRCARKTRERRTRK